MQSCATLGSDEEIGQCACGAQPLANMEPCGACFGAETDVSNFEDLCASLTGSTGSGGTTFPDGTDTTLPSETTDPLAPSSTSSSTTDDSFSLGGGSGGDLGSATTADGASTTGAAAGEAGTTAAPSIPLGGGFSATRSLVSGESASSPSSTGGLQSGGDSSTSGGVAKPGVSVAGSVAALIVGAVWLA